LCDFRDVVVPGADEVLGAEVEGGCVDDGARGGGMFAVAA
jgi:hypothetical protein